jgi:hypothetical protein
MLIKNPPSFKDICSHYSVLEKYWQRNKNQPRESQTSDSRGLHDPGQLCLKLTFSLVLQFVSQEDTQDHADDTDDDTAK